MIEPIFPFLLLGIMGICIPREDFPLWIKIPMMITGFGGFLACWVYGPLLP